MKLAIDRRALTGEKGATPRQRQSWRLGRLGRCTCAPWSWIKLVLLHDDFRKGDHWPIGGNGTDVALTLRRVPEQVEATAYDRACVKTRDDVVECGNA